MIKRAIYPGTFDPVHYGHLDLMHRAAKLVGELIVGVYDHSRPTKSIIFDVTERIELVQKSLNGPDNITVMPFTGLLVQFARHVNAPVIVRGLRVFSDFEFEFRSALANKRLAPEIETISLMTREEHTFLSSTTVREVASLAGDTSSMVPPVVAAALHKRFHGEETKTSNRSIPLRD